MNCIRTLFLAGCSTLLSSIAVAAPANALPTSGQVLEAKPHHLGGLSATNWPDLPASPEGTNFTVNFQAEANSREIVVGVVQRGVDSRCPVQINGKQVAVLKRNQGDATFFYELPPQTLTNGLNQLSIAGNSRDNIVVGPIHLYQKNLRELLRLQPVTLTVSDARNGKPVPARITITDPAGNRVEIRSADPARTAVRHGLIYTLGTETQIELPAGQYELYATRGMEWSRDHRTLQLGAKPGRVELKLEREVDTTGFIAADTHIHTLTFSGHGDSSVEERMVTLAGEGVELAVATDHNHNTDYRPYQQKMCVEGYFTAVTGNEVTTAIGHFNAFPLNPNDPVPDHKLTSWADLVAAIRAKQPKVVIYNHPTYPSIPKSTFTQFGLNRVSGEFTNGVTFPFDAMELANALSTPPDPLYLFQDWFALLNYGGRITAIGSSDSHTVGDPVGQGRTFVPSNAEDVSRIDVDEACKHFLAGETCIGLGIFANVMVDGRFTMGQTNSLRERNVKVRLRVAAPSWVKPRRALVFFNGQQVGEKQLSQPAKGPTDTFVEFNIKRPIHDAHLVCVVLGDGITHPSWKTDEDFTLAATNPIFLDANGDGQYSSPRATARQLLAKVGTSLNARWEAVENADDALAVQMVSLMAESSSAEDLPAIEQRIAKASRDRPCFKEFLRYGTAVIAIRPQDLR